MTEPPGGCNQTIRKTIPEGWFFTSAGKTGERAWKVGIGTEARFFNRWEITVDPDGVLFVADRESHMIRRITPGGNVTMIGGQFGMVSPGSGSTDGTGDVARCNLSLAITIDSKGRLFIADCFANTIRRGIQFEGSPCAMNSGSSHPR